MLIYLLSLALLPVSVAARIEVTPTTRVLESVSLRDELQFEGLETAIERQLRHYDRPGVLRGQIRFGNDVYDKAVLRTSLLRLREIAAEHRSCLAQVSAEECGTRLDQRLNSAFRLYVARAHAPRTTFTAYYSPDLQGSRTPSEVHRTPIYSLPPGNLARAFERVQIDHDGALAGKGLELFWVKNGLFDIYLLHVQGGGRISIENGDGTVETRYLSMTGHNGKKCEFIGHEIARRGWLPRSEALRVSRQRELLEQNPELTRDAFRNCRNYIYFRESTDEPVGRDNIPLTEGRSIAVDHKLYPTTGLITFVRTRVTPERSIQRFFLAQDTGSKIRGPNRSDLYMGYGALAEQTAYTLHQQGEQYFLVAGDEVARYTEVRTPSSQSSALRAASSPYLGK